MKGWEFEVRFLLPRGALWQLEIVDMVIAAESIQKALLVAEAIVRFSGDKSLPINLTPDAEIIAIGHVGPVGETAKTFDLSALADDVNVYNGWCRIVEELGYYPYEVKFIVEEGKVLGFVPKEDIRPLDQRDSATA